MTIEKKYIIAKKFRLLASMMDGKKYVCDSGTNVTWEAFEFETLASHVERGFYTLDAGDGYLRRMMERANYIYANIVNGKA